MCLKFKAEHAEDNTHSESLLVSWYWLWFVQQRIHNTMHTLLLYWAFVAHNCPVHSGFRNERVSRTQPTQFTNSISLPFLLRTISFLIKIPHITRIGYLGVVIDNLRYLD